MSKLQESLQAGKFTVTGEIGPPKGVNIEPPLHEAEEFLKGRVVAVNVTDIQTAVMRLGSMSTCHMLVDRDIEPVFQMVCRDRNRLALQSDLLSAYSLGVRNVLALTGDHVQMGDHKEAKPVHDLDSVGLLQAMSNLEKGTDMGRDMKGNRNKLDGAPEFFKGCCVTPCADELEPQILKLEKKVAAGAQFVQTQAVYQPKRFEEFMKQVEHIKVPILVGIVVLKNVGMARYMNRFVPGVYVPKKIVNELKAAGKDKKAVAKASIKVAGQLVKDMKDMCQGAHLMTLGWDKYVPDILEAAGL